MLPHLAGVEIERIDRTAVGVVIWACARRPDADCHACGGTARRVHSRYDRKLADAAISGQEVVLRLGVRRFFCDNADCPVRTFAEQLADLTTPRARRSPLSRRMLEAIGLALAGRAGARLARAVGVPASRNTLLRMVRALPEPEIGSVAVLGVDDFALRKGAIYGTVLIDMGTHRPVDVLEDRQAETLAAWLADHPGTQVVCRDRAGAYAEGARTGAPGAIQVADRWHLWHNLAEQVEKTVAAHHGCLRPEPEADHAPEAGVEPEGATDPAADLAVMGDAVHAERRENSALVKRTKARYEAVQARKAAGKGIKAIMRELGLAKETVRRFYRADSLEELLVKSRAGRLSVLDEFKPYLRERWNAGVSNASALFREITKQGYRGSLATVASYVAPFRAAGAAPPAAPAPPKVRRITSWMLTHPGNLDTEEQGKLEQVLASCPHLESTATHVRGFAEMLTGRRGERLDDWMSMVNADDLPHLHRFVRGLRQDYDAVLNGLTLPHSSGAVEGNVNRIKMIKRQMFGRAGFSLLRKRVLLAR